MLALKLQLNNNLYLKDPQSTDLGLKIINRSIHIIDQIGFEAFTFKKLSIEIESTEASIYRYFENKHKLLLYLITWYWAWTEYIISFETHNIFDGKDKLLIALRVITEKKEYDHNFPNIDEPALQRIVIAESDKTYLTKQVDDNNKEGLFRGYKSLCKMIKANLDNLYIKAPISGRLSTVNAEVGESIAPGQNIGQIDDLNGYKVRASIDEHYISRIYDGLDGSFPFAGEDYGLRINKIYPEVNGGLFQVDMGFTDSIPPSGIRRGQTLQIRLQLSQKITAVQIPRGGFYRTTGGNWIFVVDNSESYAVRRDIRLGRQNPRYYEVLEGLQPGEKVVVSSYEGYEDKDRLVFK
ncbi:MAG: efflux RND transporter periplasmic adaptor subunit [Bacteroidota bacterium]